MQKRGLTRLLVVIITIILWCIICIPPYERSVWNKSELNSSDGYPYYAGYKAGKDFPRVHSLYDIESIKSGFFERGAIEVDAAKMVPTGVFCELKITEFEARKSVNIFTRRRSPWGQLYEVTLENNDKVLVLIDDYLFKVPQKGMVVLPIFDGYESVNMAEFGVEFSQYKNYCDCATAFAMSEEYRSFVDKRQGILVFSIIASMFIILAVGLVGLMGWLKNNQH